MGARGLRSARALAMSFETTHRVRALSDGFARKGIRIGDARKCACRYTIIITIALSMPSRVVSLICRKVEFDLRNCSGRVETLWTCSGTWADY
jgi:hypothetical protein